MEYTSYARSNTDVPFLDGSIVVTSINVDPKLWNNSGYDRSKFFKSDLFELTLPSISDIVAGKATVPAAFETWIGDPPPNQNYNVYVDPFQWPWQPPHVPYDPYPAYPVQPSIQPIFIPTIVTTTTSVWPPCAWQASTVGDVLTVTLDIPGIRAIDATVEIECGVIRFAGKRHDTGLTRDETYAIGNDYDPETAKASIEAGVLTVTVQRFGSRRAHKVTIEAK